MKSPLLAATPLIAVLAWTAALVVDAEPWTTSSALMIGTGIMCLGTVSTVGMIVTGGRWSHRSALFALGLTLVVAIAREIDSWWWIGVVTTAVATIALMTPTVTSGIRRLPAAAGPSPRAILPALALLAVPALLGFAANESTAWAALLVGLSAPVASFLYSRVVPGGLIAIRIIWPALALAIAPWMGWSTGLVAVGLAAVIAALAWHPDVSASFHPPVESGTTFPIPPELAPTEILDAARIDDRGNPL